MNHLNEQVPQAEQQQHGVPFYRTLGPTEQVAFNRLPPIVQGISLFSMTPMDTNHRALQHDTLIAMAMAQNPAPTARAEQIHLGVGNKLKDIPKPEKYRGSQQGNAARHWLRDCERYFETRAELTGVDEPDAYKVIIGRTHLTEAALVAWRGFEVAVESGHMERIATKTAEADRYRLYISRLQRGDNFPDYFRKLQEASLNLLRPADSYNFILQLVSGLNQELRAEWYKLQNPPTEVTEVYNRLVELERGYKEATNTRANRFQTRGRGQQASHPPSNEDAMDLSLIENKPNSFMCYHCNKPGHFKRDCRSLKKEGKAEGQIPRLTTVEMDSQPPEVNDPSEGRKEIPRLTTVEMDSQPPEVNDPSAGRKEIPRLTTVEMDSQPPEVDDPSAGEEETPRLTTVEMEIQPPEADALLASQPKQEEEASMRLNSLRDELNYFDGKVQRTALTRAIAVPAGGPPEWRETAYPRKYASRDPSRRVGR
ncbi:hypothetical protein N7447_002909 [Penicillium robsamsonii]|uniref:uncharacterized protein n=1 Tax=Penicillium robsamsonii TaxID=1792511 RepID=UPI002548D692|nr:uncharacterized protein N7447_002909 [Penicillium robsamsonii]KAJ5836883.1 hypothetical protein N7447_002909 [Penicillium robsamsonii]